MTEATFPVHWEILMYYCAQQCSLSVWPSHTTNQRYTTHLFQRPVLRITWVSHYQNVIPSLDFVAARDDRVVTTRHAKFQLNYYHQHTNTQFLLPVANQQCQSTRDIRDKMKIRQINYVYLVSFQPAMPPPLEHLQHVQCTVQLQEHHWPGWKLITTDIGKCWK